MKIDINKCHWSMKVYKWKKGNMNRFCVDIFGFITHIIIYIFVSIFLNKRDIFRTNEKLFRRIFSLSFPLLKDGPLIDAET